MKETEIGKTIIIGISFFDDKKKFIEQYQTNGIIEKVSENKIIIKRENTINQFIIPNDDRAMKMAEPGEYKERTTGKIIKNPEYIAQWAVNGIKNLDNIKTYKEFGFKISDN